MAGTYAALRAASWSSGNDVDLDQLVADDDLEYHELDHLPPEVRAPRRISQLPSSQALLRLSVCEHEVSCL